MRKIIIVLLIGLMYTLLACAPDQAPDVQMTRISSLSATFGRPSWEAVSQMAAEQGDIRSLIRLGITYVKPD